MGAGFNAIVKLKSLQFSDGYAAQQLSEDRFARTQENIAKLHKRPAYHAALISRVACRLRQM
jgi:hypothetical protein